MTVPNKRTSVYKSPNIKHYTSALIIPNGCFDAHEVKVNNLNKGIFYYQENVKLISHFKIFFFTGILEFAS